MQELVNMKIVRLPYVFKVVFLLASVLYPTVAFPQSPPHLVLEEISTTVVPDSFLVGGLFAGSPDSIVMWSPNSSYLLVLTSGRFREVGMEVLQKPVAAAFVPSSSRLEVIDAQPQRIVTLIDGSVQSQRQLSLPINIESAVRIASGWYVGGRDSMSVYSIIRIRPQETPRVIFQMEADSSTGGETFAHLSAGDDGLLVAVSNPPYRTFALSESGDKRLDFAVDNSVINRADFDSPFSPIWKTLPIFAVDNRFVQTVTDAANDERKLLLFDSNGDMLRYIDLQIPFGIAGGIRESPILVVLRRLGEQEIATYAWRWRRGSFPN